MANTYYVPGIAYNEGASQGHLWTVLFYSLDGTQFAEAGYRRSGAEPHEEASPSPYRGLLRLANSIMRPGQAAVFWLVFRCPVCGAISEFALLSASSRCTGCGGLWTIENAVAEMAIENVHWQSSTQALRTQMAELAAQAGFSISEKSLF
jgi:hypothetical protein